jgi:predicted transcriptional regulator
MKLNEVELSALLGMLALTSDDELNCDDCLVSIGRFAEAELLGKSIDAALDRVRQHLAICSDCREEYEALMAAIRLGGSER